MPTQNSGFVPSASFTAEDYYVWTRCDGATSLREIILMVGLGVDRTIEILRKLHKEGAIVVPGLPTPPLEAKGSSPLDFMSRADDPSGDAPDAASYRERTAKDTDDPPADGSDYYARAARRAGTTDGARARRASTANDAPARARRASTANDAPARARRASTANDAPARARRASTANDASARAARAARDSTPPPAADEVEESISLGRLSNEEAAALAANVDLPIIAQQRIILARRNINNYFDLLGIEPGVGKRQLKRAYFRFSKLYHPDCYFGRDLGPFGPWLQKVFETSTQAYNELSDSRRRKAYEARVLGVGTSSGQATQTREEHADELFERACEHEIGGDTEQALKLFGAACRINPKPKFVSRAARCALRARKLGLAEDYAKTAASLRPKDPSYARLLADVFRAAGRLDEAESTILRAIELNSENDVLMTELRTDLEGVQRAKKGSDSRGSQSPAKRSER